MAVNSYRFDAHNGYSDPSFRWENGEKAFDGAINLSSTSPVEHATYSDISTSTKTSGYLEGSGTAAPMNNGFIGDITQVRVRMVGTYKAKAYTMSGTVYSGAAELGTCSATNGTPAAWGSYVTLTAPTGGWSWQKVRDLKVRFWGGNYEPLPDFYYGDVSMAEVEVTSTTPPMVGSMLSMFM